MKISNKIIWFGLGGIFGCVVALVLFLRISTAPLMAEGESTIKLSGSKTPVKRSYPIQYFSGIRASGNWNLAMQQSETYGVEVEGPEYLMEFILVEKDQSVLRLDLKDGIRWRGEEVNAIIKLPKVDNLRLSGSVKVDMQGFHSERLKIKASGSTHLAGRQNSIYYLTLKSSGSTQIDLIRNPITHAEIDLSGSATVSVSMAGGDLKGSISGSGTVTYDGEIRDQEVRISGSGSVKRIKNTS